MGVHADEVLFFSVKNNFDLVSSNVHSIPIASGASGLSYLPSNFDFLSKKVYTAAFSPSKAH